MGNLIRWGIAVFFMLLGQFAFLDFGDLEWWRRLMGFLFFVVAWELVRKTLIDGINENNPPWQ